MGDLSSDFQDLIELLTSRGVEFIVVGAYALANLGYARYTEDIDLWVKRSDQNARLVREALRDFGIVIDDEAETQLKEDRKLLQFGVKPQRVDILTFLDGCDFDVAIVRSDKVEIGGRPISFLALEDYVLTKRASGRRKDLRDLDDLREALGQPLPEDGN